VFLQEIQVELAGLCNATCSYCTWRQRPAGKQLMHTQTALRVLEEARAMGVEMVRYHGLGEPLLHPDLLTVIARGESLGFDHSISTNCSLLEGDVADGLAQFPRLSVILALHWVMPTKFVERCAANAEDYLARPNCNRRVYVQMVCSEDVGAHCEPFVARFLPLVERAANALIFLKQPQTWPRSVPVRGFVPARPPHPRVQIDAVTTPCSLARGCAMPERFLMVMADGSCAPCCVGTDDWGLPNIADVGLSAAWSSPRMAELRALWSRADDSIPCGYCKKRTDCLQ
jgi:MoaA/NifB/PqqE/SkfB family radical SAM enzyme